MKADLFPSLLRNHSGYRGLIPDNLHQFAQVQIETWGSWQLWGEKVFN